MRIKICGITTREDAHLALHHGADALGFLVGLEYPSDDECSRETAAAIIATLPPMVSTVLVTHLIDPDAVIDAARVLRCSTVQLHGEFPPPEIPALRRALPHLKITRVVHVEDQSSVRAAAEIARWADALHLDTRTSTRLGGTGLVHDWEISGRIARDVAVPVILAGGLTPANVRQAIEIVRPYAVDVNTGVDLDNSPRKSPDRLRAFVESVRRARLEPTPIG